MPRPFDEDQPAASAADVDSGIDKNTNAPRADQGAYNFTPSQAATTVYTESMAGRGTEFDTESRVTTYTYVSDADAQRFLKKVDNRSWNVLSDTYFLPTDDDEWSRLDKQHVAFKIGMNGLYPEMDTVRAVLAPEAGVIKKIADLGCGTGVWSQEMAMEFPQARVVGVDIAPTPIDAENIPKNCFFEIDDLNLGLAHWRDEFDVCHSRLIASGLQDFRKSMQDVHSCLKPGGVALWMDVDYDLMSSDEHVYLPFASDKYPSGSWTTRMFYELRRAAVKCGGSDIYGMAEAMDEGLWNDPLIDPETCKTASLYLPIGPWLKGRTPHETQQLQYVGSIMRQDLMVTQRAIHTLLKKAGWKEETLNDWSQRADDEMMENKMPILLRMRFAWGRRRAAPGEPAPPLLTPAAAQTSDSEDVDDASTTPYPYFYVYHSREESMREAELRNRSKIFPPPPEPTP